MNKLRGEQTILHLRLVTLLLLGPGILPAMTKVITSTIRAPLAIPRTGIALTITARTLLHRSPPVLYKLTQIQPHRDTVSHQVLRITASRRNPHPTTGLTQDMADLHRNTIVMQVATRASIILSTMVVV